MPSLQDGKWLSLRDVLWQGDWLAKIDLKDAYPSSHSLQVPTFPVVRKCLLIQFSPIWPGSGSPSFHETASAISSSTGCAFGSVPGWFSSDVWQSETTPSACGANLFSVDTAGILTEWHSQPQHSTRVFRLHSRQHDTLLPTRSTRSRKNASTCWTRKQCLQGMLLAYSP